MAVNISNTKYYKKGEKLPDGTTAKRGTAWNTKTNKPLTGKVVMPSAGQGAMSGVKSYKGGRSVASIDRAKAKKKASSGSGRTTTTTGKNPPPGMSAAEKARALRLKQNKGVKGGTLRMGAKGKVVRQYNAKTGRWEIPTKETSAISVGITKTQPSSTTTTRRPKPAVTAATYGRNRSGGTTPSTSNASGQYKTSPFGPYGRVGANASNAGLLKRINDLKAQAAAAQQRQNAANASAAAKAKAKAERERLLAEIARLGGK